MRDENCRNVRREGEKGRNGRREGEEKGFGDEKVRNVRREGEEERSWRREGQEGRMGRRERGIRERNEGKIGRREREEEKTLRSSLVVRASDCQCTSCNGPGFDPSIRRHSGI